uniref:Uncharacterized protein n=1 Tax=viral metagenome TaxID=1070528 RepID=A0A6C0M5T8_9ZZZZ
MAKTHHRRRHRRANRTRRGGGKHSAAAASAAPPPPATHDDLAAIFERVKAIAAKAAEATPQKISKPPTQSAIDKIKKKQFENILAGKTRSKDKSAFRHDSGQSDPRIGRSFVHGNK